MVSIHVILMVLKNIVCFFMGAFGITLIFSITWAIVMYIISAVGNRKPSKAFRSIKIAKFSVISILLLVIPYVVLLFTSHFVLKKLDTGRLSDYPDSEWVSEDGKVVINIISEEDGTCVITDNQSTIKYDVNERGTLLCLLSADDKLKVKIYVYTLDDKGFYAEICDNDEQWQGMREIGKIVKFHRVYE